MNVLARLAGVRWREKLNIYSMPRLFHEALLASPHRTADAAKADLFFVPVWDFEGAWGPQHLYERAVEYVAGVLPFWSNRSLQWRHLWAVSRDVGSCYVSRATGSSPWSIRQVAGLSAFLTHWGGVTDAWGDAQPLDCFRQDFDLVVPPPLRPSTVARSPFLLGARQLAAQNARRRTRLFFWGSLCWNIPKAHSLAELAARCSSSYLPNYSFGLRRRLFAAHHQTRGFRLYATDFPQSLPRRRPDLKEEMLRARFCLSPTGTGWATRTAVAIALGCVPVLLQDDGVHPPVVQPFEPLLDWDAIAVRLRPDDILRLPQLLDDVDWDVKQAALRHVWTRFVWRQGLRGALSLDGPDAFDTVMELFRARLQGALDPAPGRSLGHVLEPGPDSGGPKGLS